MIWERGGEMPGVVGHVSDEKGGKGRRGGAIEPHYHAHNRTQEHGVWQQKGMEGEAISVLEQTTESSTENMPNPTIAATQPLP